MSDDEDRHEDHENHGIDPDDVAIAIRHVVIGVDPDAGPEWATLRCTGCGREAQIPVADLPLGFTSYRDEDGVRLALCADCQPKPSRAERRRRGQRG